MSDSDTLKDISDDLKYFIKSIVPNSVYNNEENPDPDGGGGDGGGGASVLLINVVIVDETTITLDQKAKVIYDAYMAGTQCIIVADTVATVYHQSIIACSVSPDGDVNLYRFKTSTDFYDADNDDDYPYMSSM